MPFRPRVAFASPFTPEFTLIADSLTPEGFEPIRLSQARLMDELRDRSFDLLIVDASVSVPAMNTVRARNPLLPVIVLGEYNPSLEAQVVARGAMYLPRPVDRELLVCSTSMAIMESRPSRRSERKPAQVAVVVRGVPSLIVDVSREGMRVEIPRGAKGAPPPPMFDVAVPMLGVALNVRRLWIADSSDASAGGIWYGGELLNNSRRVELAWTTLVDALPASRSTARVPARPSGRA